MSDIRIDDVHVWIDPDGGINITAQAKSGDPAELSSSQARRLAAALVEIADEYDNGA